MGISIPKVPQDVPVANASPQAIRKMIAGRKFINPPAEACLLYTSSFKKYVVETYLNGEGSYRELAVTYNIPSENTIRQWILKYNGHETLKASGTGGQPIIDDWTPGGFRTTNVTKTLKAGEKYQG